MRPRVKFRRVTTRPTPFSSKSGTPPGIIPLVKTSLLRPTNKRIVLTGLILGLSSCSTQPKRPPYPRHYTESDPEGFYRQQQQVLENQPLQPYLPPTANDDEPYQSGPPPEEQDQNQPYGQEQPPPEEQPSSPSTETGPGSQNPPDIQSPPTARPGKNGIVESPFAPGKSVDIQGYPPGTAVKDPYTGKVFLTPMQPPAANQ
jgi:hypothetical protein